MPTGTLDVKYKEDAFEDIKDNFGIASTANQKEF